MNLENVKVGRYHILTMLLLSVNFVIVAISHALTIFYQYTPRFFCQDEFEKAMPVSTADNHSDNNYHSRTYGCANNCPSRLYAFDTSDPEAMGPSLQRVSVAVEWQLVCEREALLKLSVELYYGAMLVGGLVVGLLADLFGRMPVMAVCLYAQGAATVALNVVPKYELFLIFRGIQGFFVQGLESCTYVLCMELFPVKLRNFVALVLLSMKSIGLVLLSTLDYSIPDWRILQLIVAVPTAVTVTYIWLIPESPRWLIAKGKLIEAEILLEKFVKYNAFCSRIDKKSVSDTALKKQIELSQKAEQCFVNDGQSSEESENLLAVSKEVDKSAQVKADYANIEQIIYMDEEENYNVNIDDTNSERSGERNPENSKTEEIVNPFSTFESSETLPDTRIHHEISGKSKERCIPIGFFSRLFDRRTSIPLIVSWFTASMAFHTLVTVPQQRLADERHISLSLSATLELLTFILVYLTILSKCGQRIPFFAAQIIVAIACLAIGVFSYINLQSNDWLVHTKTTIVIIGRVANIATFFILRLLVVQLFPIVLRTTGVGVCIAAEMMGGLASSYILTLGKDILELPRFLIGLLCIIAAFWTFNFPKSEPEITPDMNKNDKNCNSKNLTIDRNIESSQLPKNPDVSDYEQIYKQENRGDPQLWN